jgi:putative thioredoxin
MHGIHFTQAARRMSTAMAVTTAEFDAAVLAASADRPVLVDFWAPWCGPCRTLGPMLDQVAAESGDRLTVVKVNSDEEPELAQRYGIRSIPAVKLFRHGEVVAEFVGAQPLAAIRAFLEPHVPRASSAAHAAALALSAAGQHAAAIEALKAVVQDDTGNLAACLDLARVLATTGDTAAARQLLESLPPAVQSEDPVRAAHAWVEFSEIAATPSDDEASRARRESIRALLAGDADAAIDGWLARMQKDRRLATGQGREDVVRAFTLVGTDDPRIPGWRRRLAALLR